MTFSIEKRKVTVVPTASKVTMLTRGSLITFMVLLSFPSTLQSQTSCLLKAKNNFVESEESEQERITENIKKWINNLGSKHDYIVSEARANLIENIDESISFLIRALVHNNMGVTKESRNIIRYIFRTRALDDLVQERKNAKGRKLSIINYLISGINKDFYNTKKKRDKLQRDLSIKEYLNISASIEERRWQDLIPFGQDAVRFLELEFKFFKKNYRKAGIHKTIKEVLEEITKNSQAIGPT